MYVQPSRERTETFGLALLEAMAAGVPVVATDVSGLTDLVDHETTGLLVPPEDPDALAGAVVRLLTDERARRGVARLAYARAASDTYSEDATSDASPTCGTTWRAPG